MEIELAGDTPDGDKFVEWLTKKGHDARIGTTDGNFINGVNTSSDDIVAIKMHDFFEEFCNE